MVENSMENRASISTSSDIIDVNWYVGNCPFRSLKTQSKDLAQLKVKAGISRAVACDFNSLLYYDAMDGTEEALRRYESLSDWLQFYMVVNPFFPKWEKAVEHAAQDPRIAAIRIAPCLHHYSVDAPEVQMLIDLASKCGIPVNLMARLFDERVAPQYLKQVVPGRGALLEFLRRCSGEARVSLSMFYFDELVAFDIDWVSNPNLYIDVGCSKPNVASLDELPSWFPIERALFGTGAPLYYWGGSRLGLEGAEWTTGQQKDVLADNAKNFFSWD